MKTTPIYHPYIESTIKEHPGAKYLFSLLRKLDRPQFNELKKEVFKQRALHTHTVNESKEIDSTVAERIKNSQVISKKKNGRLASAIMSEKLIIYKARKQNYKQAGNIVNVKRRRDSNNIEEN